MKKIIGAVATAALLSVSTIAHAGIMDAAFGNTVTVSTADGTVVQSYFFDENGDFSLTGADGTTASGTWTADDNQVCVTVGEEESCNPVDGLEVGGSWEVTSDDDMVLTISVVEGR